MGRLTDLVNAFRKAEKLDDTLKIGGELICEIGPELKAFAIRRCKEKELAKEICQETLIVIATNLEQYRGSSDNQFRSWCYTILSRKLINYLRKEQPERFDSLDKEDAMEVIDAGAGVLSPGVRLDLEFAMDLLESVKPECRVVLWAQHILGWDIDLIAEKLGSTYDAVRMQLKRCMELAESLIKKHA